MDLTEIKDEFPIKLAELINGMLNLSVSYETMLIIVEEAISNEVMYRFKSSNISSLTERQVKNLISNWLAIIKAITRLELHIEICDLR